MVDRLPASLCCPGWTADVTRRHEALAACGEPPVKAPNTSPRPATTNAPAPWRGSPVSTRTVDSMSGVEDAGVVPQFPPGAADKMWAGIERLVKEYRDGGSAVLPSPQAGSSLREDDLRTRPYQTSNYAASNIASAIDHLHVQLTLVRDLRVTHPYAPFTIARSALETSARALWLLAPQSRELRLTRTFQLYVEDIEDSDSGISAVGLAPVRPREARLADLRKVASAAQVPVGSAMNGRVASSRILAEANDVYRHALFAWKLCSGFSHGRPWSALGMLEREEISRTADGVVTLRQTASVEQVLWPNFVAAKLVDRAIEIWRLRARPV